MSLRKVFEPAKLARRIRRSVLRLYTFGYARLHGVEVGSGTLIYPGASLRRQGGGRIVLGARCHILPGAMLWTGAGDLVLGDDCSAQPYAMLYGHGGLRIGNGVRIATHAVIVSFNHIFASRERPIIAQKISGKGITIGRDVWIGAHTVILDGIDIADGCVIGAGAIVTRSTEAYGIYVGNPARLVRHRGEVKPHEEV